MKSLPALACSLILSLFAPANRAAETTGVQANQQVKLEVLLVGTFHFRNFDPAKNLDIAQLRVVDVLTEQNQKELEEIAEAIKVFGPDKIFVERPLSDQTRINAEYLSFKPNSCFEVERNEVLQLAYRVGKKLGLKKIHCFNYQESEFPYREMIQTMKDVGQTELKSKNDTFFSEFENRINRLSTRTESVKELLIHLNRTATRKKDINYYLDIANQAGTLSDTVGTHLASEWYRRNITMLSYVQKQLDTEDRKIMLLAGASHIAMLKDFIDKNPDWRTVELEEIL